MKLLLLIFLLPSFIYCQTDTIPAAKEFYEYRKATNERLEYIELNLVKHTKLYYAGVGMQCAGLGLMGLGFPVAKGEPETGQFVSVTGGLLALIGTITIWVSHKYIGRAGKGKAAETTSSY